MKRSRKQFRASTDELFRLFGEKRRRDLLTELCSQSGSVSLFTLAEHLSRDDTNREGTIDDDVLVMLHHVDLPKLDDSGLITYDSSRQVVTFDSIDADLGTALEAVDSALEPLREAL